MPEFATTIGRVPWRRLLLEGVVIVVSILLAFAIDAWWDTSRDEAAFRRQLEVLQADMQVNHAALVRATDRMERTFEAQRRLVAEIGPEPGSIPTDTLLALLRTSFSFASDDVELGSVDRLLGSSEFDSEASLSLHRWLLQFKDQATYFRENLAILRDLREATYGYLVTVAPMARVSGATRAHGPSRFEFPTERLLSDPQLQGMMGNLAIRTANVGVSINRLTALADSIQGFLGPGSGAN